MSGPLPSSTPAPLGAQQTESARQILFVQGGGDGIHDAWDNKMVASLERALGEGFAVRYPRMPDEGDPSVEAWSAEIAARIADLDNGAVLVGHSIGGAILVQAVTRQPRLLRGILAICLIAAPFLGDGGWPSEGIVSTPGWADALCGIAVYVYLGDVDDAVPIAHLDLYARAIPHAQVRRLPGRDHQLSDDLSEVAHDIRRAATATP